MSKPPTEHTPHSPAPPVTRRTVLRCMAAGGAGTAFYLAGGVLTPAVLQAGERGGSTAAGRLFFAQLTDTHIGFHKEANPDVDGTLTRAVDLINGLQDPPELVLHTGDITHLSKPAEFDRAGALMARLRVADLHTVPGEHDVADENVTEYFSRFGRASDNRGYYAFDHAGVHFLGLNNVMQARDGGLGGLGEDQVRWAIDDLKARSASTPIVVFSHMPLWDVYRPWGWGTADSAPVVDALRRFGSVCVLNGHIHQVVQKEEGHIRFHTARSTAFPQPSPGMGPGPGPLVVSPAELARSLGVSTVTFAAHPARAEVVDLTLAGAE